MKVAFPSAATTHGLLEAVEWAICVSWNAGNYTARTPSTRWMHKHDEAVETK